MNVVFEEAYKTGIEIGQEAAKSIQEIDAVFDKLKAEISSLSNGQILIERGPMIRSHREFGASIIAAIENQYPAIIARNPRSFPGTAIAEYEIGKKGYPVKIIWSDREESCWDKVALEQTLRELLSDPDTGRVFLRLLSNQDMEATRTSTQDS